jgi:hypothetical protein
MRNEGMLSRSIGPNFGRGTPRLPLGKMLNRVWISGSFRSTISRRIMFDTKTPNASVDSARYSPRRRNDGSATSAPTTAQTTAASTYPNSVECAPGPLPSTP